MNYYQILGVEVSATREEIKKAFRVKIKELHPDLNLNKNDNVTVNVVNTKNQIHIKSSDTKLKNKKSDELITVISASRVLLNKKKRKKYDSMLYTLSAGALCGKKRKDLTKVFDYEKFLLARQDIFFYKARFFIYDLMYMQGSRAIKIYEELEKKQHLNILQDAIGWYDFFDSTFIIAEYYAEKAATNRKYACKSLKLYMRVGEMEQKKSYFKEYMEELLERITFLLKKYKKDIPLEEQKFAIKSIKNWKQTLIKKAHTNAL